MGRCAIGTPGLGAVGFVGVAVVAGAAGADAKGVAGGALAVGASTRFTGGAGCGTVNVGRSVWMGTTMRGGAGGAAGEAMGAFAAGAAGFVSAGGFTATGRAGGGAGAAGCCLLIIAFRTSPGLEMFERSILVLMPSPSGRDGREVLAELVPSPDPPK